MSLPHPEFSTEPRIETTPDVSPALANTGGPNAAPTQDPAILALNELMAEIHAIKEAQLSSRHDDTQSSQTAPSRSQAALDTSSVLLACEDEVYQSIQSQFPSVAPRIIQQIQTHTLVPANLDQLHSQTKGLSIATNSRVLKSTAEVTEIYPSYSSYAGPLSTYFSILLTFVYESNNPQFPHLMRSLLQYQARLAVMQDTTPWEDVFLSHQDYMQGRLAEMRDGNYAGWNDRATHLREDQRLGRFIEEDQSAPAPVGSSRSPTVPAEPGSGSAQFGLEAGADVCDSQCP